MTKNTPVILIAEDDRASQIVASERLKRLGYATQVVPNGRAAVEAVEQRGIDIALILMDCHMPVMDGYSATEAIRRSECSTTRHIPIVAMTASSNRHDCMAAGMDDFIGKPYSSADLQRILGRWIPATQAYVG